MGYNIKYLDKIDSMPGSKFYTHPKYNCMGIKYKNIENAIRFSNKHKEIGYFTIGLYYPENKNYIFPENNSLSIREAIDLRRYGKHRCIFVASNLSEIYGEELFIGDNDFFIDYGFVFGDEETYHIGTKVRCSLPYTKGDIIELDKFGWDINGVPLDKMSKENILNSKHQYQTILRYADEVGNMIYPLSTLTKV